MNQEAEWKEKWVIFGFAKVFCFVLFRWIPTWSKKSLTITAEAVTSNNNNSNSFTNDDDSVIQCDSGLTPLFEIVKYDGEFRIFLISSGNSFFKKENLII